MKKRKSLNEMFQAVCGISINEDYDGGGSSIFYKDIEGNAVGGSERNYNDFGESKKIGKTNGFSNIKQKTQTT